MKKILLVIFLLVSSVAYSQDNKYGKDLIDTKIDPVWVEPEVVFPDSSLSKSDIASIEADKAFLKEIPKTYENLSPKDMKNPQRRPSRPSSKNSSTPNPSRNFAKNVIGASPSVIGSLLKRIQQTHLSPTNGQRTCKPSATFLR